MPLGNINRLVWAAMLVLLAVLAVRTSKNFETYFATVGRLDVSEQAGEGAVKLSWTGRIEAPMARRIAEVFRQHSNDRRPFLLALSSPGGSLEHGAEVAKLLREIAGTRQLDTVVESGRMCASMCVPVYLQGQRRVAAEDARFMFHDVSYREYMAREDSNVPQSATDAATDQLFRKYFTPAGVPDVWIRDTRAEMKGGHDIWKTARELVEERSGIVQQLED